MTTVKLQFIADGNTHWSQAKFDEVFKIVTSYKLYHTKHVSDKELGKGREVTYKSNLKSKQLAGTTIVNIMIFTFKKHSSCIRLGNNHVHCYKPCAKVSFICKFIEMRIIFLLCVVLLLSVQQVNTEEALHYIKT